MKSLMRSFVYSPYKDQDINNMVKTCKVCALAEAASCEGVITECEVRDALKQVGLNKSPGLDSLPCSV